MNSKIVYIVLFLLLKYFNAQTDQAIFETSTVDENFSTTTFEFTTNTESETNDGNFVTSETPTTSEISATDESISIKTEIPTDTVLNENSNFNSTEQCGKFNDFTRIINGETVIEHSHPWLARMEQRFDNKWYFVCGGTLISKRHVLTAAHCVYRNKTSSFKIRLTFGVHNCEALFNAVRRFAIRTHIHEDFNPKSMKNDIALIDLDEPVNFSRFVQPIKIGSETDKQLFYNRNGTILGWGIYEQYGNEASCDLLQASIPIIPNLNCSDIYNKADLYSIRETNICALYNSEIPQDSCRGDSGGPMLIKLEDRYEQIGITSWGLGCAEPNYPGVYTYLPKYQNWIRKRVPAEIMC